jgi:hypothetical protein
MSSTCKRLLVAALVSVVSTGGTALVEPAANASPASLPAGTVVKMSLESGTDLTFDWDLDGGQLGGSTSCTSFTATGTVEKGDTTEMALGAPKITKCHDNTFGDTDRIKATGKWRLRVNSAGTELSLVIPKQGATFTLGADRSCTVIFAPAKAASVTGSYDSSNGTVTYSNANFPSRGKGCTSTAAEETATLTFSPNPGKIPPFVS